MAGRLIEFPSNGATAPGYLDHIKQVARKAEHDLLSAGAQTDFHIYPGVDHAFFNASRPDVYDESAANDAWQRTVEFFRANLK